MSASSKSSSRRPNTEILAVLEYMEKEKGISRANMALTIKRSIEAAAQKSINAGQRIEVTIDPKNGHLSVVALLTVTDSVSDPVREIHISEAKRIQPGVQLGEEVRREFDPADLGRIAAQAVKQSISQGVRQFEKEHIFDEFKGLVDTVVVGIVRRRERGDIFVELGKAEATLPAGERTTKDKFEIGERIKCLLLAIENKSGGPEIILSRKNPRFVQRLLETEVSEFGDGIVYIAALAREAGSRTKIAVDSRDPKIDPVGACVGSRGQRVRNIVRELNDEKVDIIRWSADPVKLLHEAVKPAVPTNIIKDDDTKTISFEVSERDFATAIGRHGQNIKLTARLLGWKLNIKPEARGPTVFEQKKDRAIATLADIPGIDGELAERLVHAGFTELAAFEDVAAEDLIGAGFTNDEAARVVDLVMDALAGGVPTVGANGKTAAAVAAAPAEPAADESAPSDPPPNLPPPPPPPPPAPEAAAGASNGSETAAAS
ncbi:MAG: transcription termination factor NusA [Puniceicoccales bacterium]|jgi:N utilization substance protein A|nr:transcription termination factor NusA [Puniceicoccales bacterium]